MSSDEKVVPFNPQDPPGAHGHQQILTHCKGLLNRQLRQLTQTMFDQADDTLFEMADNAESNNLRNTYFDLMRTLRLQRHEIETSFMEQVAETFHRFMLSQSSIEDSGLFAATSMDDLALVDNQDLEEDLATRTMVAKARSLFSSELYAIEQRLMELMPSLEIDDDNNPFSPKLFCDAFSKALGKLSFEIEIKLLIYKLFDKYVISQLGDLYDEVNNRFITAGVLPQLKNRIRKLPSGTATSAPADPATDATREASGEVAGGGVAGGAGGEILSALQSLLHGGTPVAAGPTGGGVAPGVAPATGMSGSAAVTGGMGGPATSGGPGGAYAMADTPSLVSGLSALQMDVELIGRTGSGETDATTLKAMLLERIGGDGQSALNQVDSDIIDVVSMMFDFILEDHNLPMAAKAAIGRLQIPMIKVAMLDKDFFANKSHPARRLLNALASAGIGLNEEEDVENAPRFVKMEDIVHRVLNDFQDDLGLFEQLLEELETFVTEEEAAARALEEAALQPCHQREEFRLSRTWVAEAIRERIRHKRVPQAVLEIIGNAWRDVLLDTYLNEGEESPLWKQQLHFIDILVWSVEMDRTASNRQKLATVILELLHTLRSGLAAINYSEEEIGAVVKKLEPLHLACFGAADLHEDIPQTGDGDADAQRVAMSDDVAEAVRAFEDEFTEVDDEIIENIVLADFNPADHAQAEDIPDDEYLRLARHLDAGKWVEFTDDNGRKKRARLVWKSDLLGECTFLDWKHSVVADTTFQGLAADFRRGTARVLEDVPLIDRAINAVFDGLKRRAG